MTTQVLRRFNPITWPIFSICIGLATWVGARIGAELAQTAVQTAPKNSAPVQ